MDSGFRDYLLKTTKATDCEEIEVIQSLWSGYGKISRYRLHGTSVPTVVVKCIALQEVPEHPRGWNTDRSHQRKEKSYEVETHWYEQWSQYCTARFRVPKFLGSLSQGQDQWIVLEDLDAHFPVRKIHLELEEVKTCLQWLVHFHATFLGHKPAGLWEVGTYWHLATRPDELEKMHHLELKSKATLIDKALNTGQYQTIVHGDAKLANFCFSEDGKKVAAVDFQYVGGGCGMKDVAYFLGSCLSSNECKRYEQTLLDFYFSELEKALQASESPVDFGGLEEEWRGMYPLAIADFTRFLLGWMPTHQKVNDYHLRLTESALSQL